MSTMCLSELSKCISNSPNFTIWKIQIMCPLIRPVAYSFSAFSLYIIIFNREYTLVFFLLVTILSIITMVYDTYVTIYFGFSSVR